MEGNVSGNTETWDLNLWRQATKKTGLQTGDNPFGGLGSSETECLTTGPQVLQLYTVSPKNFT